MKFINISFLLLTLFVFSYSQVDSQTIFSDISIIQPKDIDTAYTTSFGWKTLYRGDDAFISVVEKELPWVQEYFIDGVIYYYALDKIGDWIESVIYPQSRNLEYNPVFNRYFAQPMQFGRSFSVLNSTIAVGATGDIFDIGGPNEVDYCGSVFLFEKNEEGEWIEKDRIYDNDPFPQDNFGRKVLFLNNQLLVFSFYHQSMPYGDGMISIFEQNEQKNWEVVQEIFPTDSLTGVFGLDMAGDNENLVLNSLKKKRYSDIQYSYNAFSFYTYNSMTGLLEFKQEIVDSNIFYGEGLDFVFQNDELFVGLPSDNSRMDGSNEIKNEGSVTVYKKDASQLWYKAYQIHPNERYGHRFGNSIDINGIHLFVGASLHEFDQFGSDRKKCAGALYVFKRNENDEWDEIDKIIAPDRDTVNYFGVVSVNKNKILITAPGKSDSYSSIGSYPNYDIIDHYKPSSFYLMEYDTIVDDFIEIKLYPNPTIDYIEIELLEFPKSAKIHLFNIQGQLISKNEIFETDRFTLSVDGLPPGTYIIMVSNEYRVKALKFTKM